MRALFSEGDFQIENAFTDVYPRIVSTTSDQVSYRGFQIRGIIVSRQESPQDFTIYHPALQVSKEVAVNGEDDIYENLSAIKLETAYYFDEAVDIINENVDSVIAESAGKFDDELSSSTFVDDYEYIND